MDTENTTQKSASMGIIFDVPKEPKSGSSTPQKDTAPNQNSSHLSSHGDVFNVTKVFQNEHGDTGTIISDRRRHRQSFGESLKKAFDEWWSGTKVTVEKAVANMPTLNKNETTIATAVTRAEVVNEAVKHSALSPRDDHHVVLEQFHTLKSDVARLPEAPKIVIKQPSIKNTPASWSHTIDESSAKQTEPKITIAPLDLRSSVIAPDIARKNIKNVHSVIPPIVPQKDLVPRVSPVILNEPGHIARIPIPDAVSHTPLNTVSKINTPLQQVTQTVSVPQSLPPKLDVRQAIVPQPQVNPEPNKEPENIQRNIPKTNTHETVPATTVKAIESDRGTKRQTESVLSRTIEPIQTTTDTHVFHTVHSRPQSVKRDNQHTHASFDFSKLFAVPKVVWLGIGGVVLLVIIITTGIGMYSTFSQSKQPQTYTVASFYTAGTSIGIPLTSDQGAFHTLFTEQLKVPNMQSVQIYPTLQEGESLRPATTNEFFATLGIQLPHTLVNTLDDSFMIGGIMTTTPEPYLIIRSYNFDALFAGLLEWEGTMHRDLSPLFGTANASSTLFTDAVQNNRSTRILHDPSGNEMLLYSFIDQKTVIITTSGNALSALLEKF